MSVAELQWVASISATFGRGMQGLAFATPVKSEGAARGTRFEMRGLSVQAGPYGEALIVYETIIDDERRTNAFGLLRSINMLIETREGFDYTAADCIGRMKAARVVIGIK